MPPSFFAPRVGVFFPFGRGGAFAPLGPTALSRPEKRNIGAQAALRAHTLD